jgi:hypothetical protein
MMVRRGGVDSGAARPPVTVPTTQTATEAGRPGTVVASPMRILIQMPFPGYLRNYGSTVRLLAERGHRVLLSYDAPDKRRDPSALLYESHEGIDLVAPIPPARRRFERAIAGLRLAIDYVRYLDRRFAGSPYLRRRLEKYVRGRPLLRPLTRVPYGVPFARTGLRGLLALERLLPSDARVERAIASLAPDVVFVTPLLGRSDRNRRQTDTVKAARSLGIPVGAGIATWDHLTTKGIIKALPDRLFVWNEIQQRDAVDFHFVPGDRITVTGAHLFDGWFERRPSSSRQQFLASVGLDRVDRYVLYVGSSPNIAPPELEIPFVRRWIEALHNSGRPALAGLDVLVRPHPYNVESWAEVASEEIYGAAVAPQRPPELPMNEADEALYFDSIHHADAVVGINTTAMVEAFVARRPVLTIRGSEFRETQEATLHFGNLRLAAGDALQAAATLDEHLVQLTAVLEQPERFRDGIDGFLRTFVRPLGLDRSATAVLVQELEQLAAPRSRLSLRRRQPA